jgi:hypothetical protein
MMCCCRHRFYVGYRIQSKCVSLCCTSNASKKRSQFKCHADLKRLVLLFNETKDLIPLTHNLLFIILLLLFYCCTIVYINILCYIHGTSGHAVALLVDALRYKPPCSISDGVIWIFHWLNPSGRTLALSAPNRNYYQEYFLGGESGTCVRIAFT